MLPPAGGVGAEGTAWAEGLRGAAAPCAWSGCCCGCWGSAAGPLPCEVSGRAPLPSPAPPLRSPLGPGASSRWKPRACGGSHRLLRAAPPLTDRTEPPHPHPENRTQYSAGGVWRAVERCLGAGQCPSRAGGVQGRERCGGSSGRAGGRAARSGGDCQGSASLGIQAVRASFGLWLCELFALALATDRGVRKWCGLGDPLSSSGSEDRIACQPVQAPGLGGHAHRDGAGA